MESCCSRFTAAEGGARLAAAAGAKNLMITEHTNFIPTSLLIEYAHRIRGSLVSGYQRSIYITRTSRIDCIAHELEILTDLMITGVKSYDDVQDWMRELEAKQVVVCTSMVLKRILEDHVLDILKINVLVIDSCHLIFRDENLQYIMKLYKDCDENKRPRILAMTYPLFQSSKDNQNEPNNDKSIDSGELDDTNEIKHIIHDKLDDSINKEDNKKEKETNDANDCVESNDAKNNDTCVSNENDREVNECVESNTIADNEKTDQVIIEQHSKRNDKCIHNENNDKAPKEQINECEDNKTDIDNTENKIENLNTGEAKNSIDDIENTEKKEEIVIEKECCPDSENEEKLDITKQGEKCNEINTDEAQSQTTEDCKIDDSEISNAKNFKDCIENSKKELEGENNDTEKSLCLDKDTKKDRTDDKNKVKTDEEMAVYENLDDFEMYEKLEWRIEELEKELCCEMDLAEDIDGGKRLSPSITKPKEVIVQYETICDSIPEQYQVLDKYMRDTVKDAIHFISEHRYDPTEIYGEELYEEFMNIPDPTIEPKQLFYQFLFILDELGPYAADKAAFSLLTRLEKLKIKVPYERHFLLLCLCTSVFIKIRCFADLIFSNCQTDWEKLTSFSTPKVLRFAAILEQFQPDGNDKVNDVNDKNQKCIEDNVQVGAKSDDNDGTSNEIKTFEVKNGKEEVENDKSTPKCTNETNPDINDSKNIDSNDLNNETLDSKVNDEKHNDSNSDKIKNENIEERNEVNSDKKVMKRSKTIELLDDINECDFGALGNKIEDKVHMFEMNMKEIERDDAKCSDNLVDEDGNHSAANEKSNNVCDDDESSQNSIIPNSCDKAIENNSAMQNSSEVNEITANENSSAVINNSNTAEMNNDKVESVSETHKVFKRGRGRGRGRPRVNTKMQQQQNADSLCGIVFLKEPLMAKILFMIIVDMSRSRPALSHLCAQYCAVEGVEEPRESQRQGRKQEDVLKKFRMHECNLLLATSALEEGIDLPRCNLVVRWDLPPSYRSYGLCRSRARAAKSSVTLLANAERHSSLLVHHLAVYKELDQIVTRKCGCGIQNEPTPQEETKADTYTQYIRAYIPRDDTNDKIVINDLNTAKNDTKLEIIDNEDTIDLEKTNEALENDISNVTDDKSQSDNIPMCEKVVSDNTIHTLDLRDRDERDISGQSVVDMDSESQSRDKVNPSISDSVASVSQSESDVGVADVRDSVGQSQISVSKSLSEVKISYEVEKKGDGAASVDLNSAIALINRYCGKLPSDTFTRLAPQWWIEEVRLPAGAEMRTAYVCTLRMPLNCPVKYNIVGHPMPTRVLARRMVALQACRILHKSGELDDHLMPIGKENFKAAELDSNINTDFSDNGDSARPGTTKRRQYYYKRTAWVFTDCQPIIDTSDADIEANPSPPRVPEDRTGVKRNTLHALVSGLWCALPERYNTRGRRLHLPQHASQAIGVLLCAAPGRLQIPAFPVYTRSGEVRVSVEPALEADVRLSPRRDKLIRRFMRFVFSDVLRVRRRGMKLQTEGSTQNNYYIVPTVKKTKPDGTAMVDIDWAFLELIYDHTEQKKQEQEVTWGDKRDGQKVDNPLLKPGEVFNFNAVKYSEAVVTPWYRNQDQPQFFLVAEICWHLTPDSSFPSEQHATFRSYYKAKYGADLTQSDQPLLDVDHTSARLNLLTPRYVNRKGVALPVSSERTRRAKRDRLDQKQIMVPELCRVHPFAAPLWFATVALPCVLYRINALLIADEIRRSVAVDVGLGIPRVDDETCPGFTWPPLDFGWSLAEVLSADSEKHDKKKETEDSSKSEESDKDARERDEQETTEKIEDVKEEGKEKTINDILQEKEDAESGFEIGTWSNDMASSIPLAMDEFSEPLPHNVTLCTSATGGVNWSEPIEKPKHFNPGRTFSMADSDCSYMSSDFDTDDSDLNSEGSDEDSEGFCSSRNANAAMGVRIEYKTAHEAEAVDVEGRRPVAPAPAPDPTDDLEDLAAYRRVLREGVPTEEHVKKFRKSVETHEKEIVENGHLITKDQPILDLLPEIREPDKHTNCIKTTKHIASDNNIINDLKEKADDVKCLKDVEITIQNDLVRDDASSKNVTENEEITIMENKEILSKTSLESIELNKNVLVEENNELNEDTKNEQPNETYSLIVEDKSIIEEVVLENADLNTKEINKDTKIEESINNTDGRLKEMFPYLNGFETKHGQITLESIEKNKRKLLAELKKTLTDDEIKKLNCFSMKDVDIDAPDYVNEKIVNVGFDSKEKYDKVVNEWDDGKEFKPYYLDCEVQSGKDFDFDYQPNLEGHPGPSPSVILQALTMSNANDGINLERLETIGDSFLKFAITAYLYCAHPAVHEGKLSHMRSKQVSNLNLYRLGRNKRLGARMIASKFEPHDNWLPPCHKPPPTLQSGHNDDQETKERSVKMPVDNTGCFIPYNLITQHSIPDKSIADCVEALIGAYLLECGPRGALLFMSWLGIRVLPCHLLTLPETHPYVQRKAANTAEQKPQPKTYEPLSSDSESCCSSDDESAPDLQPPSEDWSWPGRPAGSLRPYRDKNGQWVQPIFGELKAPPSPLLRYINDPEGELEQMLSGYEELERTLQYRFRDRSLLLQALTHASHQKNRLTDCYQRLEFLGDAILDYLITRHLYEDARRHSPGALTDLRSALVNNTIFATLAARHGFHKYFRHMSPGLNEVLTKYVKIQEENGHSISEEHYLIQEDEMEQAEDVEVPKALGDLFESVAGAIFLDSGMSLGAVWRSYARLMMAELEAFSAAAPKSPVRELLEAEPDTAKFGKPERLADGRRVRVCVEVFGRGTFKGIGRNYRIAKGTAARCALRHLKIHRAR